MARTTSAKKIEEKGSRAAMSKRESSTQSSIADTKTQETLGEALLFAMLCIVGVPVEVQVKDGSVYSGIFHSANLSQGQGFCYFSIELSYCFFLDPVMKIPTWLVDIIFFSDFMIFRMFGYADLFFRN
jgi:Ataxin 2 SM domain